MIRAITILLFFFFSSCATENHIDTLQHNKNKVALFYNSKDQNSVQLIDYTLCYAIENKLDIKFTPIDINNEAFSFKDKLASLSSSGYKIIIAMLNGDNAKALEHNIGALNFTLFSANSTAYNYKHYISSENFPVNNSELSKIDNKYKNTNSKPVPQNGLNLYKILTKIKLSTELF